MSKNLILVRHAKSDWSANLPDFERPLNPRGLHDAPVMAKRFDEQSDRRWSLISSPAKRAFSTAVFFSQQLGIPENQIRSEKSIYEADPGDLLKLVNTIENNLSDVVLFGHNPGISLFATYLCHTFDESFPTCAIAWLQFETDNWAEISGRTAELKWFSYPKLV